MERIRSDLREGRVFEPGEEFRRRARVREFAEYQALYQRSIEEPEAFWAEQMDENIELFRRWDSVMSYHPERVGYSSEPYLTWFEGAQLNVSYNCLDRHLKTHRRDKQALIWQGEDDAEGRSYTYAELHRAVCRAARGLRELGVGRGSTVTIFLPMIPEAVIAMLACARVGAIHSVVFSAFSSDALRSRIQDCGSQLVITADFAVHGGKRLELKAQVDRALRAGGGGSSSASGTVDEGCASVQQVVVVRRWGTAGATCEMSAGRDVWWHEVMAERHAAGDAGGDDTHEGFVEEVAPPEVMDAESPLFILYTSGSTGKPKGVLHTSAGYLLYAHLTFKYVFDIRDEDLFWCTADVGWITGHSYAVYGPLSNGATCFMYEGVPTYPQPDRFWRLIERYRVTIFYTAPTAIRALMRFGDEIPQRCDLSSLRLIGTVGEPINPEAWVWYQQVIGGGHGRSHTCPVVDTWWQTETGGIMITTLPGAINAKPGSAGMPFFGVVPEVLNSKGEPAGTNEGGALFIKQAWPGMLRGVYGDERAELIKGVYFSRVEGQYFTGDGCRVDEDGYYWLLGRIDDVINVSGHRFATAEIESALVSHQAVAEAAVVGAPHEIKGQGIYCYVTLKAGRLASAELAAELIQHVRAEISPIASPDRIHFAQALPKTRSGKIMRRILRKIAESDFTPEKIAELGDTSTLADPSVIEALVAGK